MAEERKLSIRFYKNIYGDKGFQEKVLKEIQKVKCPIQIDQMDVEEGQSLLIIGGYLTFNGEGPVQEIFSEITDIIERCYMHEILNKKK